jgi:D-alanyl-lipoteichoic acid acyltransferase DltB (MBOAT superfamily)
MFFPHLIAGPICKSRLLIPQFEGVKRFAWRNLRLGLHLFALGYIKKVLNADPLGHVIDPVWSHPGSYDQAAVWLASLGFYLQVYADFSGYTDMGRGIARALGFRLPINFRAPYLASSPLDFWQRWHISLTTWFRHYFYQPMALWLGRHVRDRQWRTISLCGAAILAMTAIGLWHGVAWRFVLFGLLHGILLLIWLILPFPRKPRGATWLALVLFFQLVLMLSFVVFRAPGMDAMVQMARAMAGLSGGLQHIDAMELVGVSAVALFAIQTIDYWITARPVAARFVWLRRSNLAFAAIAVALTGLIGYKITIALSAHAGSRAMSDGFIYFDF